MKSWRAPADSTVFPWMPMPLTRTRGGSSGGACVYPGGAVPIKSRTPAARDKGRNARRDRANGITNLPSSKMYSPSPEYHTHTKDKAPLLYRLPPCLSRLFLPRKQESPAHSPAERQPGFPPRLRPRVAQSPLTTRVSCTGCPGSWSGTSRMRKNDKRFERNGEKWGRTNTAALGDVAFERAGGCPINGG